MIAGLFIGISRPVRWNLQLRVDEEGPIERTDVDRLKQVQNFLYGGSDGRPAALSLGHVVDVISRRTLQDVEVSGLWSLRGDSPRGEAGSSLGTHLHFEWW